MSWLSSATGSDAAKLSQKAAGKATKTAEQNWQDTAGLRKLGQTRLGAAPVSFADEFSGGPTYEAVNDPLYGQATGAASKSLASLTDGPDRMALVRTALADLDKENAVRQVAGEKRIGQRAATLGRIGNQGVTTEMGTLASDIERDRSAKANALIADAIERAQGDKYSTLAAASGLADSAYGRGASERANKQGIAQLGVTNRAARIDAERAAGNDQFGQGVSLTELGYGFSPEAAYVRQAANEGEIAARKSASFNAALAAAGKAAGAAFGKPPV
jgi:hypothetical protein